MGSHKGQNRVWLAGMLSLLLAFGACGESESLINHGPNDALNDDAAFNDIVMRCTHNSYHLQSEISIHPSHKYDHLPLDGQLDAGVRAFELDVHKGKGFPVFHIPVFDPGTTCADLGECLSVITGWSERNPTHHMLVVWIEVKDELDPGFIEDYDAFDEVIRSSLGERLYTPKDFQRTYESPRAALEAIGWPTVGETRGRVMLVLLDTSEPHYEGYRAHARGDDGPAMFSNARVEDYDAPWAVVTKENDPRNAAAIAEALEKGMLVASNTGAAGNSDEENQSRLDAGIENGSHMLCDDFPTPRDEGGYWMELPQFFPSGCNQKQTTGRCELLDVE